MSTLEMQTGKLPGGVDEAFALRAMAEADLNALRLALYQSTRDPELARMKVERIEFQGGARQIKVLAAEHHEPLKQKALAFLRSGAATRPLPDDGELRQMVELFLGEPLSDEEFAFHRTIPSLDDFPHAAQWHGSTRSIPPGFHVAIIGAGVSGIATGVQFERLGIPYTIYERRSEIGGTWSRNSYPDARVDTSNFIYQYSFEKNYPWTEYFARQGEVRSYLEFVARKHGVFQHIRFDADVKGATFDEAAALWRIELAEGAQAKVAEANVIIAASGLFGVPRNLDYPGTGTFAGEIVHTANWTQDVSIAGKDVAVIGNGSTGVQLLSTIAAQARRVTVFQRTPQWITPLEKYRERITPEMRWLLNSMPYFWNWNNYSMIAVGISQQPLQEFDRAWQSSGGQINERNDKFRANLVDYIKGQLGDRADLVAKVTPDYPPLARRLVVDNDWYATLLRDNVELVTEEIAELTPGRIRTAAGKEYPADLIVAATGFQATRYVWPMDYVGRGGRSLQQTWEGDGTPRAYLGVAIPGFPNFFIHYGPNAQPRAGSLMVWHEIWSRYTAQAVVDMIESGSRTIEVKPEIYERYNREIDEEANRIIWTEERSSKRNYYVDASGRSSVNAPWRAERFYRYFAELDLDDYVLA